MKGLVPCPAWCCSTPSSRGPAASALQAGCPGGAHASPAAPGCCWLHLAHTSTPTLPSARLQGDRRWEESQLVSAQHPKSGLGEEGPFVSGDCSASLPRLRGLAPRGACHALGTVLGHGPPRIHLRFLTT